MMTRRKFLVLAGGAAPIVAGIGLGARLLPGGESTANVPTVRWDAESCAHCSMVISDRRYGAAWIDHRGNQQHFDDVGCMVSALQAHVPSTGTGYFVRDFAGDRWLDAGFASFHRFSEARSPMHYGIAAFDSLIAARAALGDAITRSWTWDELRTGVERMG